jgi:hypothetical protein
MSIAMQTFDGIIDSAASEWFEENTKSIKAVQQYADGAFDAYLSDEIAAFVLTAAKKWKSYSGGEGQDFLYHLRSDLENMAEKTHA